MPSHIADLDPAAARRLLDQTLVDTMQRVGAHAGALYLLEPGGEILSAEVGTGIPPRFARPLFRLRLSARHADPLIEAVRGRKLVWVPSSEEYARRYPQPAMAFPHQYAMATAALAAEGTTWGGMLLFWRPGRPPELSPDETRTIGEATERCAAVLSAADRAGHRLVPPAEPRGIPPVRARPAGADEALAALDHLARLPEAAVSLDPDGRLTFMNPAAVALLGPKDRLLGTRPWESLPWLSDPVCEWHHREAVVSQRPVSFTASRRPGAHFDFRLHPDPTGVSVRITPAAGGPGPGRSAPDAAASRPGSVRLGAIHHLMHLSGALTEAAGVQDVIELVADQFMLAFDAQAFALLVAEAGRIHIVGQQGFAPRAVADLDRTPLTSPTTPGVLGLTEGRPSFFSSRRELGLRYPARAEVDDGMAAWAYLPLLVSGRTVGTCVLGYRRPHTFTAEERSTLVAFSGLIAQALDRARLYDAARQLARGLQESLLPHALPGVPGLETAVRYLPSGFGVDVGGDFYDIVCTGPAEAVAVIGDVEGHNVHAAALMGQVRTAIHAYAVAGKTPGRILVRTNQLLTDLDADLLTSCLCAQIDIDRHRVRLASAGHCPPLLRSAGHRCGILDVPPGPLLGVKPAAAFPVTEVELPPGAVLALYTDGLAESPANRDDSELTGLKAAFAEAGHSLESIADALVEQAESCGERTDDTALLLLRISGRSPGPAAPAGGPGAAGEG
ncbi:SpoIIE family protein phosphatase [Streptomyces sp. GC420]|uniref:SpoIIE family protein phosphatase n=1 Tax=Streptomyces sp. GC420 TaxID=2697568 RepID=UPI0014151C90|nr:SpoIIE family protein phosphatase [Streptomyces sp. GC420]NBM14501.1 SpoIIE family protein phosphatase [Streptomyces sp. GC420]